ncbi:hypothetical protein M378DRAFT_164086, partial [Amanita muscaria Koide BX008]
MTLGIGGVGLSSGQKQRLALPARARLWPKPDAYSWSVHPSRHPSRLLDLVRTDEV